jgi:hypothetical protein
MTMKTVSHDNVKVIIDKLDKMMDESDGYCHDTYDVRVGQLYLFLSQKRDTSRLARYLLYVLYGLELMAPLLYRKIIGISKTFDAMGNSYRAGVQLTLYQLDAHKERLDKAASILDRITQTAVGVPGRRGFALGFPCITGSNKIWKTDVPVAHYSLRVARKFIIWQMVVGDGRYNSMLKEVIAFLNEELQWMENDGFLAIAYTPDDPLHVINIWADVASLLASYDRLYGDQCCRERAISLAKHVLKYQAIDGSWPYFAACENKPGREDNTHTAMVLGALADVAICYPEVRTEIVQSLAKGIPSWIKMFFNEETGQFWNLVDRPKDCFTVCLGDALYAINRLIRPELIIGKVMEQRLLSLEKKIIRWSLDNLKLENGRFCERKLHWKKYHLESIRSFDGLICDSLTIYFVRELLGQDKVLWTI